MRPPCSLHFASHGCFSVTACQHNAHTSPAHCTTATGIGSSCHTSLSNKTEGAGQHMALAAAKNRAEGIRLIFSQCGGWRGKRKTCGLTGSQHGRARLAGWARRSAAPPQKPEVPLKSEVQACTRLQKRRRMPTNSTASCFVESFCLVGGRERKRERVRPGRQHRSTSRAVQLEAP